MNLPASIYIYTHTFASAKSPSDHLMISRAVEAKWHYQRKSFRSAWRSDDPVAMKSLEICLRSSSMNCCFFFHRKDWMHLGGFPSGWWFGDHFFNVSRWEFPHPKWLVLSQGLKSQVTNNMFSIYRKYSGWNHQPRWICCELLGRVAWDFSNWETDSRKGCNRYIIMNIYIYVGNLLGTYTIWMWVCNAM